MFLYYCRLHIHLIKRAILVWIGHVLSWYWYPINNFFVSKGNLRGEVEASQSRICQYRVSNSIWKIKEFITSFLCIACQYFTNANSHIYTYILRLIFFIVKHDSKYQNATEFFSIYPFLINNFEKYIRDRWNMLHFLFACGTLECWHRMRCILSESQASHKLHHRI